MFIKIFSTESMAMQFAEMVKGILSVRYDWDAFRGGIVKEYIVKY